MRERGHGTIYEGTSNMQVSATCVLCDGCGKQCRILLAKRVVIERQRDRERGREGGRERERVGGRESERERERESARAREIQRDR